MPGDGGWLAVRRVPDVGPDELRTLVTEVLNRRGGTGVVVLAAERAGKVTLAAAIGSGLADRGHEAREVLARAAKIVGGGAGGKGPLASAGGRHPEHLDEAPAAATPRRQGPPSGRAAPPPARPYGCTTA
ncbi:MAG: hypothetical protein GEV11_01430 [Streptosporangiales bacterium]|nr:hypothetical protein [Streptosporangiales bacterium]